MYDKSYDDDIIAGKNPVIEALKSDNPPDTIYIISNSPNLGHIISLAKQKDIVIKNVTRQKLDAMTSGQAHQGVAALCSHITYVSVDDILAVSASKNSKPFIVICDGIEDPHNLGAIIRSAECAGADGIIIPKRHSASVNTTVFKTSAGAVSSMPIARVTNLAAAIDQLKSSNVWIYGTDASGTPYSHTDLTGSTAIVIGSEGFGISRLIKDKCDFMLSLPTLGKINSLNASVAAGIFFYEALRQRRLDGK